MFFNAYSTLVGACFSLDRSPYLGCQLQKISVNFQHGNKDTTAVRKITKIIITSGANAQFLRTKS